MEKEQLLNSFLLKHEGQINEVWARMGNAVPEGANALCVTYAATMMVADGILQVFEDKERALSALKFFTIVLNKAVEKAVDERRKENEKE